MARLAGDEGVSRVEAAALRAGDSLPYRWRPRGPSGSGKSSVFSLYRHPDLDSFNVDDRSAQLNGGSYQYMREAVRRQGRVVVGLNV